MSRAGLLYTTGDPLIAAAWLSFYPNLRTCIDSLYVGLLSDLDDEVIVITKALFEEAGARAIYRSSWQGSFSPLVNEIIDEIEEDYIVLLEDDGYILSPNALNDTFEKLEQGRFDVIGSKRGSCSGGILAREKELWLPGNEGFGDVGPNFWPFLFSFSKDTINSTDREWDNRRWQPGEYIKELDYTCKEVEACDGLVWISIQLRAQGLSFDYIPQHRMHQSDPERFKEKSGPFAPGVPWCHFGSLSAFVSWTDGRRPVEEWFKKVEALPEMGQLDVIRRLAMYSLVRDRFYHLLPAYADKIGEFIDSTLRVLGQSKDGVFLAYLETYKAFLFSYKESEKSYDR